MTRIFPGGIAGVAAGDDAASVAPAGGAAGACAFVMGAPAPCEGAADATDGCGVATCACVAVFAEWRGNSHHVAASAARPTTAIAATMTMALRWLALGDRAAGGATTGRGGADGEGADVAATTGADGAAADSVEGAAARFGIVASGSRIV